jgi:hypothetical protein
MLNLATSCKTPVISSITAAKHPHQKKIQIRSSQLPHGRPPLAGVRDGGDAGVELFAVIPALHP